MENNFIYFKGLKAFLERRGFYGQTVKREKNDRLTYSFFSIGYYALPIKVYTVSLKGIGRIVLKIDFADKEINSWDEFTAEMNNENLKAIQNKERKKFFKNVDNQGYKQS